MTEATPTLTTQYTAMCCSVQFQGKRESVIKRLLEHLRKKHPNLAEDIEREARNAAMSANGHGYYDDGKSTTGGMAQGTEDVS